MKRSRRELLIDVVVDRDILQNNQFEFMPCLNFIPKIVITGLP